VEQEKVEFASPAWIELAESILTDLVSTQGKPEDEFAVCEVFHNVPDHVHSEGTVAWHFHITGQSVVVGVGEVEDVDMRIVAEYTEALAAARLDHHVCWWRYGTGHYYQACLNLISGAVPVVLSRRHSINPG
jgi:hypothetical protein